MKINLPFDADRELRATDVHEREVEKCLAASESIGEIVDYWKGYRIIGEFDGDDNAMVVSRLLRLKLIDIVSIEARKSGGSELEWATDLGMHLQSILQEAREIESSKKITDLEFRRAVERAGGKTHLIARDTNLGKRQIQKRRKDLGI